MYDNFFGFKERPFQLVPNPGYLYLSRSHEEAIAHLNYAIAHGDGFVAITGEVGTGKTTLCRAFLEDLDENTEVAYIFNPRLTSLELLRTINDEFAIPATANNTKDLIDNLNTFLMEKKAQNKNAILLIDEAQNLSMDVLEQLRLLSNLETNTSKLLQIILVGQPELRQMLDSYELRQLGQRMTLNWYLTPLSRHETREYIRHRIHIASKKTEDKFTWAAYYRIYRFSGGIPRLVNIACDRALLTAFGFNKHKVTGSIAAAAIRELRTRGHDSTKLPTFARISTVSFLVALLVLLAWYLVNGKKLWKTDSVAAPLPIATPTSTTFKKITPVQVEETFADKLNRLSHHASRFMAIKTAISQWGFTPLLHQSLNNIDKDPAFFQLAAAQNNMEVLNLKQNWELISTLNLPTLLEFLAPGTQTPCYLTLVGMTHNTLLLKAGEKEKTITVTASGLKSYWTGNAYIIWKNFLNYDGDIPIDAPKESIFTLKMLLREIGYAHLKLDNRYDAATRDVVTAIQTQYGIPVDGIVGAKTKIAIYNENKTLKIPLLHPSEPSTGVKPQKSQSLKEAQR